MSRLSVLALALAGVVAQNANAHVSFVNNPATVPYAGSSYTGTLNVPHGCHDAANNGYDTIKVEVSIPSTFTGVRPMPSTFGKASIVKDGSGNITKLVWTKAEADKLTDDSQAYQLSFRGTLPNAPFSTLGFEVSQTCVGGDPVSWTGAELPVLRLVPARKPGWNKFTVPAGVNLDLSGDGAKFFSDAAIVWKGKEGYSANSNTFDLIKKNATELKLIPANSDIWVKY